MKKSRIIAALLTVLLALIIVVPALANEGEGSMDVSPGGNEEPPVVEPTDPPVVDPPVVDPTAPPVVAPPIPLQMTPFPPRSPRTGLQRSPPLSPRRSLPPRRP